MAGSARRRPLPRRGNRRERRARLRSQSSALVFLVAADDIAAADGSRRIFLALQVAVDDIPADLDATGVLEDLDAAADAGAQSTQHRRVRVVLDVAFDPAVAHVGPAALFDLHRASDPRPVEHAHALGVLGLHVAYHDDVLGAQGCVELDLNRALDPRA